MALATKNELYSAYINAKNSVPMQIKLKELVYQQIPTPIITKNSTTCGIANKTVKQTRSKDFHMRFYWLQDPIEQKRFIIFWRPGKPNTADYFAKFHLVTHQREMQSVFLVPSENLKTWDNARVCYSSAIKCAVVAHTR